MDDKENPTAQFNCAVPFLLCTVDSGMFGGNFAILGI